MAKSTLSLQIDPEGHIIVAAPLNDARVLVAKFAPDGALMWERAEHVVEAEEGREDRDSFAPLLVDADAEGRPSRVLRAHRRGRIATASVLGAASLTLLAAALGLGQGEGHAAPRMHRFGGSVATVAAAAQLPATAPPMTPMVAEPTASASGAATDWIDEPVKTVDDTVDDGPAAVSSASAPMTAGPPAATKVTEATPAPAPEPSPPPATMADAYGTGGVLALRRAVLDRLQAGDAQTARLGAQTLVMNNPSDAFGYLCLGAALDMLGLHAEAMKTYGACAEIARHGDVAECAALLSRPSL